MNSVNKDSLYGIFLEILRLHYYRAHVLLEEIGIYPGQPQMLITLNKEDGLSQKELSEKLKIKASTITVMLNRMEKSNLVRRKQDDEDQRISRVYITDNGKKICKKSHEIMKSIEEECFGNFTNEEKIVFKKLLTQMKENLSIINKES